jgi:hypothetical protein
VAAKKRRLTKLEMEHALDALDDLEYKVEQLVDLAGYGGTYPGKLFDKIYDALNRSNRELFGR